MSQSCISIAEDKNEGRRIQKPAGIEDRDRDITQCLVMSVGSRVEVVIDCK